MSWQFTPYAIFLLLAAVGVFSLSFLLHRHRRAPGVVPLTVMMLAAGFWTLGYGLELSVVDEPYKLFWARFQYLGIVSLPVGWFAFALDYTGREGWLSRRNVVLLSVIPAVTLLLVATNGYHGLIWSDTQFVRDGNMVQLSFEHGPAFWVDWIYAYLLLIAANVMLVLTLFRTPRVYQIQGSVLLFAVAVPWIGNALYIVVPGLLDGKDLTPFAFALCGAAMFYGISNLRLLDLKPLARNAIFDNIKDGVLVLDVQGRVVDANSVARRIPELPRKGQVVHDSSLGVGQDLTRILVGESLYGELRLGGWRSPLDYAVQSYEMTDHGNRPRGRLVLLRDVTEQRRAQEQLQQSEERYRAVVEQAAEGIFLCDLKTLEIVESNAAFQRLSGYAAADLTYMNLHDLFEHEPEHDREIVNERVKLVMEQGSAYLGEWRYRRKDGMLLHIDISSSIVYYGDRKVLCTVVRDFTGRKALERRLEHRAFHDPLTELPNRALFTQRLQGAVSGGGSVAVLFVDLDDFKSINDGLGHDCGDELLIQVANRLSGCLRSGDFAARLGGDEFTVLIGSASDAEEAQAVARRVEKRLEHPFGLGERTLHVGASIGLAISTPGDGSAEDLLRKADTAMYDAKSSGKDRLKVFPEASLERLDEV